MENEIETQCPANASQTQSARHFSDIFLKTEIHGLPDWYEAKEKPSKTAWTIILVFAISLMIYELIKVSLDFHNNPILTTYSIVSEPFGMKFPEIYICPLTPIHQTQRRKLNVDKKWEEKKNVATFFKITNASTILGIKTEIQRNKKVK